MGVLQPDYLIIEIGSEENTEIIDNWIKNKVPKKFQNLFHKTVTCVNGECNYYVSWDGSKEGWSDSDRGGKIKEQFVDFVKDVKPHVHVLVVKGRGDNLDDPVVKQFDFWNGKLSPSKES